MNSRGARLAVTIAAPVLVWLAGFVTVPGVDTAVLSRVAGGMNRAEQLSVIALGLMPAMSAFVIVELVSLLPRFREARRGGAAEERRGLRRAALVLTIVLALVQGFFIARWLESFDWRFRYVGELVPHPGLGFQLVVMMTLVGGTCLLLGVAWLAGRYGLLDGFSTLLVGAGAVPALLDLRRLGAAFERGDLSPFEVGIVLMTIAGVAAMTRFLLRAHRDGRSALRLPTSGAVPFGEASLLLVLPITLANLGVYVPWAPELVPGSRLYDWSYIALTLVGCAVYTVLFHLPRRRDPELWRGAFKTGAWIVIVLALSQFARRMHVPIGVDSLSIIVITAVALDLIDEWRFRGAHGAHGALVAVAERHVLADVDDTLAALAAAGVAAHARGANHRALLRFFGPYVPVMILVPVEKLADARRALVGETTEAA
jgi:preprotein translocase subunit SecY